MNLDELVLPTLHPNGSSAQDLMDPLEEASDLLRQAVEVLRKATPNARDYYVQSDPSAAVKARQQHRDAVLQVEDVNDYLLALYKGIRAQRDARVRKNPSSLRGYRPHRGGR